MKHIYTTLALLCLCFSGFSQNSTIKGNIQDSTDNELVGATAILYYQADSLLAGFALTNEFGQFEIPKVAPGNYYLQLSYIGFENQSVSLDKDQFDGEVDLGTIKLKNANIIDGVEIRQAPLEIRKDTIVYDATVFNTRPNATVEDLLKQLPGIEVEDDGSITAQGEQVENVLVDGKKFFGDDPKIATKNLPAEAVQNVEVYDQKSEKAEFTGVEDGQTQKTINLDLKDDHKNGVFGNINVGGGTDELYTGKASLNRFSPGLQLSTIVSRNNINDQAFTFRDYIGMNGGGGFVPTGGGGARVMMVTGDVPGGQNLESGINTSTAAGVNLNASLSDKTELHADYFFNQADNNFERFTNRQELLTNGFISTNENNLGNSVSDNHRMSLDFEFKLDSMNQIEFNNRLVYSEQDYFANNFSETIGVDGNLSNDNTTFENNTGDSFGIESELFYKHRFKKKGRSFFAEAGINTNNSDFINLTEATTNLIEQSESVLLNQQLNADDASTLLSGSVSYTEPVGEDKYLQFDYALSNDTDNSDRDFFDIVSGQDVFNDQLSNEFEKDYISHRPGMSYRFIKGKHNVNVGMAYEFSNLEGATDLSSTQIDKDFNQLLPSFNWRIELDDSKNLNFNYSSSLNEPGIRQLQPAVDNSNPLNVYVGNPNLDAETQHNVRANFFTFDRFSFTNVFAFINASYTADKIVNAQVFDENNIRTTTPVNTDGQLSSSANVSFSKPIRSIRTRVRVGTNVNYTDGEVFINGNNTDFNTFNHGYRLNLSNTNDEKIDLNLSGRWNFNNQQYAENEALDQSFLTQRYAFNTDFTIKEHWELGSSMNYNVYSEEQFGADNTFAIWNAYLKRSLWDNIAEVRLSVNDILSENTGINRTNNLNYSQEEISNVIGQYGMVSFRYNIRSGRNKEAKGDGNTPRPPRGEGRPRGNGDNRPPPPPQ
ncbi:MAG: TonB-dependent receptor family protein [Saprospiraceae bacterium]|nr:TonB-dependent receptor family protein [Saprospiraceae bacterium]